MKVSQMDWPAELQNIPERIDRVIKQGSLLFEIVHKRKNGEPIQHEVNSQRIIWDDKPAVMSICRDISERKLAEKKLLDSEEKFRLLFNSGKDYMAVHLTGKDGQPGNFIQVNDAACEILGYTSEEMLQLSPRDVDSAKKSGLMPALIEKLIKNKHILFETEMIAKNGETIPMEVSLTLFQLQENQATICVARDLTERNRTSEKISKSNMLLNAIIENIPSTIFLKDAKDLRFLLFNKAAEDLAGYSSADVLGKSDYDFLSKEQADFFTDKDRDVLRGTKVVDIPEEPLQTRNKGQRILHTKKVPIFSTKGEPEYLLGISEDITDRKLAEEALVKSEEKYRNLSISSLDAIITEDLDGIITFANPAAQNLAGGLNLVGMSVKDFIPPELISKYNEMMEARRHGYLENISYEWSMILPKDGSIVVFDIRSSIIINKSNPSEILIVARDITERKRAEEELANSADKYRRIAENMIDSTFLLDRNGVFQYATNHKDKLGYELEDLIGITGMSITHPDELERIQRIYEGGVDGVWQEITYETRIRHKDGHYVPMEIRGRTFADHSGKISGAVFSGREIIQNQQKKQKTPSAKKSLVAVPELSAREKEILNWVVRGKSTWDIAKIIDIGEATVKYHIDKVMKKLSAVNRTHAAAIALRNKMLN